MSSPFASMTVSEPIPVPFGGEGQWIQVRKLTGREHTNAQTAHRLEFVRGEKWAGFFKEVSAKGPSEAAVRNALADPLTGYDRHALVRAGLVAWSFPQSLKPIQAVQATDTTPAVAGYDAIDDLDDDALEFCAREVLKRTKPGLFEVAEEDGQAAQVKG